MVKVREDMKGWKMWEHGIPDSRLTVIEQTDDYINPRGVHYARWLCECSCEERNIITVVTTHLKDGHVKSCGCLNRELTQKRNRENTKHNIYNLDGDYGIGLTSNTNREFYFDLEGFDKIKNYTWHENTTTTGYKSVQSFDPITKEIICLPWVIAGKYHDHKDRNPFNNKKDNLRPATLIENAQNHSIRKDNKSGYVGVNWAKNVNKWHAYITYNYNQINLGYFDNKYDAIMVRLKAEQKYFGDFAPQRHLFEEYGIVDNVAVNDI